ncbi:MAG: PPOX class probable FMN-dependent enzyme [Arenicella sp.]|jgi:PPOX class probable FMN-dependent enzyme
MLPFGTTFHYICNFTAKPKASQLKSINSLEQLAQVYGEAVPTALWKEISYINDHYRQFIEKSPFLILATSGENGLDCSPRGDPAGFVRVVNEKCIQLPDRRGNNRLDSIKNIIRNPAVGLIFLVPNAGETIRLSGKAEILVDDDLCQSFAINGKAASSVLSISVEKVYFQCQKAIARSKLWDTSKHIDRSELPTAGQMVKGFAAEKNQEFDSDGYDKNYPERMKETIY